MDRDSSSRDRKLAAHVSEAPTLSARIGDMEARLAVERAQVVAHTREFGGSVRRRLTSPTSLLFAGSMGFIAAELVRARSAAIRAARQKGGTKGQQQAAGKSVFQSLTKPVMALVHLASMGFLMKKNTDVAEAVQSGNAGRQPAPEYDSPRILH